MSYHYIIMSQQQMFQNQVLEEILRERTDFYLANNKEIDFWILVSPSFLYTSTFQNKLKETKFYEQFQEEICDQTGNQTFAMLVTTNTKFANWIKLRLGYFESWKDYKTTKNSLRISDGVAEIIESENQEVLKEMISNPNMLHISIRLKQFEEILTVINSYNRKK